MLLTEPVEAPQVEVGTGPEVAGRWDRVGFVAVVGIAAGLRLWRLDLNGFGNPYYAAAVRSMLGSWGRFFFGSFDPAGLVTVDKPPAAIWVQAAAAKLLGYSGLSLLLPQALMGTGSVVLTYHLVRRAFGAGAGLLAGLILAITPICVAVDRENLPDTALVFVLLLAAWALSLGAESGRLRPLLLSAALVGVGFNIKMLAAFVALPTFYLVYLAAAPIGRARRLGHLAAATLVLMAVSLSWAVAVELTPKDRRPFIGGSRTDSALDLALGYNGLGRILGGNGNLGPPGPLRGPDARPPMTEPARDAEGPMPPPGGPGGAFPPFGPPGGFPPGGPGGPFGGGMPPIFGGTPGPLRFAAPVMAGQITWLFPIAILGAGVAAVRAGSRWPLSPQDVSILLWAGWLGTHWVVFSFARGIFHEYYTTVLGPAVAALAGIGIVALFEQWRHGGGRGYLPLALVVTAAWQLVIVARFPVIRGALLPTIGVETGVGVLGLIGPRWLAGRPPRAPWARLSAGLAVASLLAGPACWSVSTAIAPGNPLMPAAGPSGLTGPRDIVGMPPMPPMGGDVRESRKLVAFLRANRHGERIFLAAPSSMEVASIIVETGEPAVSLGGFMGADPVVTEEQFARMVEDGEVRFVMLGGGPGGGPGGPPGFGPGGPMPSPPGGPDASRVHDWVREHGKVVDAGLWRDDEPAADSGPESADGPGRPPGGFLGFFRAMRRRAQLYDCRPEIGLIAAGPAVE